MKSLNVILTLLVMLLVTQQSSAQTKSTQTKELESPTTNKPVQPETTQTATDSATVQKSESKPATTQQKKDTAAVNKTLELTFDDIKFEMEKDSKFSRTMLTPEIREYHNSNITIRGYIQPNSKQTGLKKFVFVRDNKECCFGPGAALYDCMLVQLSRGTTTEYTTRPITITGKFFVKEYRIAGKVWAIYRMSNTKVK